MKEQEIEEYVKSGGELFQVTFITTIRDGGTKLIETTKSNYYVNKDNYKFHNGYPTSDENLITDELLNNYLIHRIETYIQRCEDDIKTNKNLLTEIKNYKQFNDNIKTIYSKMLVENKYYGEVTINGKRFTPKLTNEQVKNGEQGYVLCPYLIETMSSDYRNDEYDEFMEQYRNEHKYCPECGGESCSTTLVGYPLIMDKKEDYKDLNKCICTECGNKHTYHERTRN